MPSIPAESPKLRRTAPDLLSRAASVLAREAAHLLVTPLGMLDQGAYAVAPAVRGVQTGRQAEDRLGQQDEEFGGAPFGTLSKADGAQPAVPLVAPDRDRVRRQAHELLETLLAGFSQGGGERAAPYEDEDQVPLIRCLAPVQAGDEARATMRVANEGGTTSEVTLYCSNFIADSGYEIPSLRVTVAPRKADVPPGTEAAFEIKIAVSRQTPAGIYSGLIQASGSKYVKAVLLVEVL